MDAGAIFDQLGDGVTVGDLLEAAASFPTHMRSELESAFVEYASTDVVQRSTFVAVMNDISVASAPAPPSRKMEILADLFDSMGIDGYIQFDSLKSIFGDNAGLIVPDTTDVYDFNEFVENFGDLFDDNGDIRELPPTMIEQLRAINHKISALSGDVTMEHEDRIAAEERLVTERRKHAAEKAAIFDGVAEVEEHRDSLYQELKDVKRQLAIRKQLEERRNSVDDFDVAVSQLAPALTRYASTHSDPMAAAAEAPPIVHDDEPSLYTNPQTIPAITTFESGGTMTPIPSPPPEEGSTEEDEEEPPERPPKPLPPRPYVPPPPAEEPPVPEDPGAVLYSQIETNASGDAAAAWATAKPPLISFSWYKGKMDRPSAESYLRERPTGAFVVRDSSMDGKYALSIRKSDKVLHYIIMDAATDVSKGVALHFVEGSTIEMVEPICDSIPDLIDWFKQSPVNDKTPLLVDDGTSI